MSIGSIVTLTVVFVVVISVWALAAAWADDIEYGPDESDDWDESED